ncbi:MAG TPA: HAD family hydrolase [Tepidiformaceae bacterium]|nr:HAD family hydrolase [Tepidiformaceae bacterium]
MTYPRAILFDLDDTILDCGDVNAAWLTVVGEFCDVIGGLEPATVSLRIRREAEAFWSDPDRHRIHRQDLRSSRRGIVARTFEAIAREGGPALSMVTAHAIADRLTMYREEQICLFPGAIEAIEALRGEGVRLALVTNGASEPQRAKIEQFDLARHFDHVQVEGEMGFGKPEERAYRHALQALDADPEQAWMVGDNLEWEVAAPQRIGMSGIWYDHMKAGLPEGSPHRPDRIILSLTELL